MTRSAPERLTAKAARAVRKASLARIVASAFAGADESVSSVAAELGISRERVREWGDPDSGRAMPASDLGIVPESIALPILRELARLHGYTLAPLPVPGAHPSNEIEMLARAATEHAEAVRAMALALKDPRKANLAAVVREADEAIEVMAAVRERARAAVENAAVVAIKKAK